MRIAVMQTPPIKNGIQAAVAALDHLAEKAARQGADVLVTPEMFLTGYNIGPEKVRRSAQMLGGPLLAQLGTVAERNGIAIVTGLPELGNDGKLYNTAVFVGPDGHLVRSYRKTHLYGEVDRAQFSAGDSLCSPFIYKSWKIALAVCYDIEFPEVARTLATKGVELILTPTANMVPYDSVATRIVPARAQENTIYIAYANYVGSEPPFDYCGLSCICGPDGEDIARAGRATEVIYGDISKQNLRDIRKSATHLSDLKPELYQVRKLPEEYNE